MKTVLNKPLIDTGTSPHLDVRPSTPLDKKHAILNLSLEKAEALLQRTRRKDTELSTRSKIIAVLKKKLINQLKVPTSANPSFHLYREVDLLHTQAAKSVFWDFTRTGPTKKGKNLYYNWECDSNETIGQWFKLEERRENGIGQAMMRNKGQVLVMARPPLLVEHQENEETEGVKLTAGLMTLNCRGVARFAPPPPPEENTADDQAAREAAAARDEEYAWGLAKAYALRGEVMDRHWYRVLHQKFPDVGFLTWLMESSDEETDSAEATEEED